MQPADKAAEMAEGRRKAFEIIERNYPNNPRHDAAAVEAAFAELMLWRRGSDVLAVARKLIRVAREERARVPTLKAVLLTAIRECAAQPGAKRERVHMRAESFLKLKQCYPVHLIGEDEENTFDAFELALDHGVSLYDLVRGARTLKGEQVPLVEFLVQQCWIETPLPCAASHVLH